MNEYFNMFSDGYTIQIMLEQSSILKQFKHIYYFACPEVRFSLFLTTKEKLP